MKNVTFDIGLNKIGVCIVHEDGKITNDYVITMGLTPAQVSAEIDKIAKKRNAQIRPTTSVVAEKQNSEALMMLESTQGTENFYPQLLDITEQSDRKRKLENTDFFKDY